MKSKGLHLSFWVLISILIPFTYQFQSGESGGDSKEPSRGDLVDDGRVLEEPKVLTSTYDDEDLHTTKPEFMTLSPGLSSEEDESDAPKTNDEHPGEAIKDEEIQPTPILLDENTLNSSINGNETHSNDTKPPRTVALCSPISVLVEDAEGNLTLSTLPVSPEDFPLINETSQFESAGGSDSSSSGEEYSYAENDEETPVVTGAASVRLVNMSELVQDVLWSNNSIKSRVIPANCSIVLFYASWCPFSAKAAPHFNALPRAFPTLRVAAIDVSAQSSVNSYFGILSVPTVILFHNGKSIAKFNESNFSLNKFAEFVHTHTDLRSDENINVTSQDFMGPLPSVPTKVVDVYLIFAWIFIAACFFYYVTKSALWRRAIDLVRTTWREAEDHVHQD